MFVVNLSHCRCCVTRSVQVKINDYLRSLRRVTVPRSIKSINSAITQSVILRLPLTPYLPLCTSVYVRDREISTPLVFVHLLVTGNGSIEKRNTKNKINVQKSPLLSLIKQFLHLHISQQIRFISGNMAH